MDIRTRLKLDTLVETYKVPEVSSYYFAHRFIKMCAILKFAICCCFNVVILMITMVLISNLYLMLWPISAGAVKILSWRLLWF